MSQINSLTTAQQVRFGEFVLRWTEIGLSTDPADRPRAERAIVEMYAAVGLLPPSKIVWCGSPLSQGITRAIILDKKLLSNVGKALWASVRDSVGASVRASVRASVGASVWDSVRDSVGDSVYGQHDASWLAFYSYFNEACDLKPQTEKLRGLWALCESSGWALPHENICWVSERHNILERDDRGRLHCVSGPACAFPDGWGIYAVHGVRVPAWIVERKDDITPLKIDGESNAEVRRVMVELYGEDRYIVDSGLKPIAQDEFGELFRKDFSGDTPLVYVKVKNSTAEPDGHFKDYFLSVNPNHYDGNAGRIPHAAIASTWRTTASGEQLFFKRYQDYRMSAES